MFAAKTPLTDLIETAVSEGHPSDDPQIRSQICSLIQSSEPGPRDAARVLKKKLNNKTPPATLVKSLLVLKECMNVCGTSFHAQVADKQFMDNYAKLVHGKNAVGGVIREQALELLQDWKNRFQNVPMLGNIVATHILLVQQGVEFPDLQLQDSGMPASQTMTDEEMARQLSQQFEREAAAATQPRNPYSQQPQPVYNQAPMPQRQVRVEYRVMHVTPGQRVECTREQKAKIRGDLDVVEQNVRLLSELVSGEQSDQTADVLELIDDIARTCKSMQERILQLCEHVTNEDLTGELLVVNDKINDALEKHGTFQKRQNIQSSQAAEVTRSQQSSAIPTQAATAPLLDFSSSDSTPFLQPSTSDGADESVPNSPHKNFSEDPIMSTQHSLLSPTVGPASTSSTKKEDNKKNDLAGADSATQATPIRSLTDRQQQKLETQHDDLFAL
eukprot:m.333751 g.333751  ORF g.333751 m.333751 type:complete len:444 (+) comp17213_c0_seq1:222-1553(+)